MKLDSFSAIGKGHKVNQDYTYTFEYKGEYIIIVSDGCSGAKDSDVGARILAHCAKKAFIEICDYGLDQNIEDYDLSLNNSIGLRILNFARDAIKTLNLNEECLHATLLMAFTYQCKFYIFVYGDGAFYIKFVGGKKVFFNMSYTDSKPNYLLYLDKSLKNNYLQLEKQYHTIYNGDITPSPIQLLPYTYAVTHIDYMSVIETIALFSDGIETIQNSIETKPHEEVIPNLVSFKNTEGVFLHRRCNKYLQKCLKLGFRNFDDLSCAVMVNSK